MYENRLLCWWVYYRYRKSIAYRIAVEHAQARFTGKHNPHQITNQGVK